ncbi:hypothetical protein ACH5RR_013023 [Cinchona calisaya]|uniref:Uncharacterized protein n=1 Tax=Cinchona calisaya TaxID=153742 RepID=A0ABD3A128_9GENT
MKASLVGSPKKISAIPFYTMTILINKDAPSNTSTDVSRTARQGLVNVEAHHATELERLKESQQLLKELEKVKKELDQVLEDLHSRRVDLDTTGQELEVVMVDVVLLKVKGWISHLDLDFHSYDLYNESATTDLATKIEHKFRVPWSLENLYSGMFPKDTSPEVEGDPTDITYVEQECSILLVSLRSLVFFPSLFFLGCFFVFPHNLLMATFIGEMGNLTVDTTLGKEKMSSMSSIFGSNNSKYIVSDQPAAEEVVESGSLSQSLVPKLISSMINTIRAITANQINRIR